MENNIATINQGRPVYFSYARNSSRKPEWEHISDCVDPLLNTMTVNGLEYRVDVKDIGMGDKISKFEEEIGWNSEVVVIIFSDKYFRSMHCMYEFVQIKRALEKYPEKRLMCIKSGDFNLSDVNYIMDLERYWNNQKIEYENIEFHRLREHSGTEIAAYENGFYLDDIRKLYSFFSAINYSNSNSINYDGFIGDIVRYYNTTPKPKLTPKPSKSAPQQQTYFAQPQPTPQFASQTYTPQPQPAQKKSPVVPIAIAAVVVGLVVYLVSGKKSTSTDLTSTSTEQTATTTEQSASTGMLPITINGTTYGNMIFVQGGTFQMGASDSDAYDDEQPVHSVTVSDFYIGETEVTQGLWRAVMGGNPSYFTRGDNYPVERVSWNDCQEFIYKLNQKTGKTFRLPTEAEWEYAARGGNQSNGYKYSGSNNIDNVAVYDENSYNLGSNSAAYGTHAVKTMSSNELGLYDMSGNVFEWCSDWYGFYSSSSQTNPRGASSGSLRVARGGCWYGPASLCRVSNRSCDEPVKSDIYSGLRLVLVP